MSASLRDVAARAGVSVKTVSNVVNGYAHVRESTRTRVQAALDELNYQPNMSARHLRKGRSGLIAVALPELDLPYFAELARCVIKAAEQRGWTVLIDQTDGLPERESVVLAGIRGQLIDGLIFSPLASTAEQIADRTDDKPMVLLGERFRPGSADHVAIDNVAAARAVTEHLISLGRSRIAAIGDQHKPSTGSAQLRREGYADALRVADMPVRAELITPAPAWHRHEGAAAMATLLDASGPPPDAVFCFNDMLALGAIRTLLSRGFRVPEDVAVAGFDDVEDGRYSTPTLTTIAPDKAELAELAVSILADRIDGDRETPPQDRRTSYRLICRESTTGQ